MGSFLRYFNSLSDTIRYGIFSFFVAGVWGFRNFRKSYKQKELITEESYKKEQQRNLVVTIVVFLLIFSATKTGMFIAIF